MSGEVAWVTGAAGLIGNYLVQTAARFAPGWRVKPILREQFDLTDFPAVDRTFNRGKPGLIIHCAALSRSAACQADPVLAAKLNVAVTQHLCELAEGIPMIFFSTDLVFDGCQGNYVETDPVHPLSIYADTKVQAEHRVLQNPRHTIVRVSLNTGVSPTGNRSFTEEMRRAWEQGETLKLFTDEFRCPIPATVTARAVWELVERRQPGLYHLGGSERLSRWEIGRLMAKRWPGTRASIEPALAKDYPGPPRPLDTSLDCSKIQALLSFRLPGLTEWLANNPDEAI
jgi:dTDP-4-dehydrorhamnose reductase